MEKYSISKTAFSTENGDYEFSRVPFGLKGAHSTFQIVMNNKLRGIQNERCAVYMDEIIVFRIKLYDSGVSSR